MSNEAQCISASVTSVLDDLGIPPEVVIFGHYNLALDRSVASLDGAKGVLDGLRSKDRTFILPAFTYSFAKGEVFDPSEPPARTMGSLSQAAFANQFERSFDPMFSLLGSGPRTEGLFSELPNRSFGPGSTFHRLTELDGWIVNINMDAGTTFAHHIEYIMSVPHRYEKIFFGTALEGRVPVDLTWISYVRDLSTSSSIESFARLTADLESEGLWRSSRIGSSKISAIPVDSYVNYVKVKLRKDPAYLTRKSALTTK